MKKRLLALWAPLLALVLFQGAFVALFLLREHSFPFWDYAMYANMAKDWFAAPGWRGHAEMIQKSLGENYNLLFAIPSYLGFSLFGTSREVFIGSNFLFFFVTQQIALGLVLASVFGFEKRKALLWSFGLAFLVPLLWHPLLHGYPDHAAAACLTFALVFALKDSRRWYNALALGLLLGAAILLRRYFAYPALALLFTLGLTDLGRFARGKDLSRFTFFGVMVRFYGMASAAVLLALVVIEPNYFEKMLTTDYQTLYKSYDRGAWFFCLFALSRMGLVLLIPALAGYVALARAHTRAWAKAQIILGFTGLSCLIWAFGPAQSSEHYLLPMLPVFCFVGLTGLWVTLRAMLAGRAAQALYLLPVLLAANSAYALWFAPDAPLPSDPPKLSLLSTPHPPWVRKDYDEVIALARYVEQTTRDHDHIAVLASSFILNQDLFRTVYLDVLNRLVPLQRFLAVSEIDGVQPPPYDAFAGANVYIVPTPPQYHLGAEGQKVMASLYGLFPPPMPLFPLFEREARTFKLDRDVVVSIWHRRAWTPEALHAGLSHMRTITNDPSLEWVAEERGIGFRNDPVSPGVANLQFRFGSGQDQASLFYDKPLHPGSYRLGMYFTNQYVCSNPTVTIRLRNDAGETGYTDTKTPLDSEGLLYIPFMIPPGYGDPFFLSVDIKVKPYGPCSVGMWQTQVEEMQLGGLPNTLGRE